MALFKKKPAQPDGETPEPTSEFTPQPDKARKWFEHAKTAAMSSNYDYALRCYASGIRLDPGSLPAHEGMLDAAVRHLSQGAKPASSKEVKAIDDGSPMGKFAAAEFEWMKDLTNPKAAMKALEASVKAEQLEIGHWMAPRISRLVLGHKKLTKALLLQAMELFREVGAWDESLLAGQTAHQIDPSDADLDAQLKNLSAQRAMDQGGYDQAGGEEGGFRKFIKDADRQRELIEDETLAANASIEERNLSRAKTAYRENPSSPDAINKFAQLLRKSSDDGEELAYQVYMKGFKDTGEYRFRMNAGDISIDRLNRQLKAMDARLETANDEAARTERDELRTKLLALRLSEYTERVEKYPTDRFRKYDLGAVQMALNEHGEAMAQFQAAKDEPKLRVRASHMLGRCFFAEEWHAEAISEYDEALAHIDATEKERELDIRYDLMLALLAAARADASVDHAQRAKQICSEIARKDITFRDIRLRRKEVDEVIKALGAAGSGA